MIVVIFILMGAYFSIVTFFFYIVGWHALAQMSFWVGLSCLSGFLVYLKLRDRE